MALACIPDSCQGRALSWYAGVCDASHTMAHMACCCNACSLTWAASHPHVLVAVETRLHCAVTIPRTLMFWWWWKRCCTVQSQFLAPSCVGGGGNAAALCSHNSKSQMMPAAAATRAGKKQISAWKTPLLLNSRGHAGICGTGEGSS